MDRHVPGGRLGAALLIGTAIVLACCADETDQGRAAQAAGATASTGPAAAGSSPSPASTPSAASASVPVDDGTVPVAQTEARNDPSAPLDTPLCGRAARERIAIGAALEPDVAQGAGACGQTACFDPATDTFIGADGFRHVCQ